MAPQYKLTYFNMTGLGEPIRYLFAYGNIDYVDDRIEQPDWPQRKPDTPFGIVPVFEVDGKRVHQTSAICRFLAQKVGLAGKTDVDALQADVIVDTITDYRMNLKTYFTARTEEVKVQALKDVENVHNPYYFERFEKIVAENGGYFVNNQLTWADLYFAAFADIPLDLLEKPIFDKYPNLKALKEKVDNIPAIKEWRAKRPKTSHHPLYVFKDGKTIVEYFKA